MDEQTKQEFMGGLIEVLKEQGIDKAKFIIQDDGSFDIELSDEEALHNFEEWFLALPV
jgi:hypothetical protein